MAGMLGMGPAHRQSDYLCPCPVCLEGRKRQPRAPDSRAGAGGELKATWADQEYAPLPTMGQNFVTEAIYFGSGSLTKSVGFFPFS